MHATLKNKPREVKNHYPIRIVGYILVSLEHVFIFYGDASFTPIMWIVLAAYTFAMPHLIYIFSNTKKQESYNFAFECAFFACLLVLWGFNEILVVTLVAMMVLTSMSAGGVRALIFSIVALLLFIVMFSFMFGFYYREELNLLAKFYAVFAFLIQISSIGYLFNKVNRRLTSAKRTLSKKQDDLVSMNELAKAVNASLDLDALMETLLSRLGKNYDAESIYVAGFSHDRSYVQLLGAHGDSVSDDDALELKKLRFDLNNRPESLFLKSLLNNEVLYIPDVSSEIFESKIDKRLYKLKPTLSMVFFPIEIHNDVIGGIAFLNYKNPLNLSEQDLDDISLNMLQVGAAIKNIRLFERAKQAQQRAEESEQAKSRFLANMSHEIRTPMTAILGYSEALQDDHISLQERKEFTRTIIHGGQHLLSIINDILDISKIEADKIEVEMLDVNLPLLLKDLCNNIKLKAVEKSLSFNLDITFPIPFDVRTDPTRLKQVLFNLASNAIKFTEKGSITVKVAWDKAGYLMFSVEDTGIGLTQAEQGKLFQAFSQADTSTTRIYGGTGLGLYISKNLIQLMGGDLSVESEKGKGSRFIVKIEMLHDIADAWIKSEEDMNRYMSQLQDEHAIEHIPHLSGRILVADDTLQNQQLIRHLLEKTGLQVDVVGNGQEAVSACEKITFDLVFLDIQMPIMGGIEAAEIITSKGFGMPLIAFTANVMKHQVDAYKNKNFFDVLEKPISRAKLYELLESHFLADRQLHRILIVDDNKVNRMVLARYSNKLLGSVDIDEAENGEEALNMATQQHYDLIFMDMEMPKMGGLEATELLREQNYEGPIYMVTGNSDLSYVRQGEAAGANGHIVKPIDKEHLASILKRHESQVKT